MMTDPFLASALQATHAGMHVHIDLQSLAHNFRLLKTCARESVLPPAPALKANAYGLGMEEVARCLRRETARTFFVALPEEGLALRALFPTEKEGVIYVLNGLFNNCAPLYAANTLRPVLNTLYELETWYQFCRQKNKLFPAALHIDTGFHRLGLSLEDMQRFYKIPGTEALLPSLMMSHFSCADLPEHPMNAQQLSRFQHIVSASYTLNPKLSAVPLSLCNSAALLLLPKNRCHMPRPGIALYGGMIRAQKNAPVIRRMNQSFKPVVTTLARLLQLRHAAPGESIGYGASYHFSQPATIGIVSAGYADGYLRSGSSSTEISGGYGWCKGHRLPIIGRISMDLTAFDVTPIADQLHPHRDWIELFGPHISLEELALWQNTIPYEILTSLSPRATRSWTPRLTPMI